MKNNEDTLKKKKILIIFLFIFAYSINCDSNSSKKLIIEAREKYKFLKEFVTKYPEKNLLIVMNFSIKPDAHFEEIKGIPNLFSYFEIMDRLAAIDERYRTLSFETFLTKNFKTNNLRTRKVDILTYLLIMSKGYFGEILADLYTKLFSQEKKFFINYLSKRKDWKTIVDFLDAGDWNIFKQSVEQLQDYGFEGEFKKYVFSQRDKDGRRIVNK